MSSLVQAGKIVNSNVAGLLGYCPDYQNHLLKRSPGDRSCSGASKSQLHVERSKEKQTIFDFKKFRRKDSFSLGEN